MDATTVRTSLLAGARGLALTLMALIGSITLFVLTVVSLALSVVGIGVLMTPAVLALVRAHANLRRRLAPSWGGVRIPAGYRPLPQDMRRGLTGQVERCGHLLRDPATWRDVQWLFVDFTAGAIIAVLAPGLLAHGVFGLLLPLGLWGPLVSAQHTFWYTFVPVSGAGTAVAAALVGCALIGIGLKVNPLLVRTHFKVAGLLAAPSRAALEQRIGRLTETRHDALDTSAAELRRIERDLHDGAQARLVAVGMNLSTVEALIERDPAQAKELIGRARATSAEALAELRDLVRGIHPPVLAERGLGDAVKALALRLPLRTDVDVELTGRAEAPVESAAYFAVSEALANAVKHSGAERVWVDISHRGDALRIAVTDNGKGGASADSGSGLSGVERRLGTFDGILAVSSPVGGPTMITMEIPCALS
ncbi:sensor domain-containing protein [Streptomyces sp. NPDC005963]|uniref:sensor histidine kinase n=1 Tax=Streptomyces sp. NPDC005963 TaxID=3156721 RepID=UPI0033C74F84